jgi:hypothetical protein
MRRSLEHRRLAVAAALRAVAAESVVGDVVDAVDARLDELSGRLDAVLERLGSVETTLLEIAWDRPAPEPSPAPAPADDEETTTVVSVPAVDLGHGRMSSVAAKALFGH